MNITETYRLSFRPWYPGYQRFFLECDEELRRSADTPKTRARKTFGNHSSKASGTQGTAMGD